MFFPIIDNISIYFVSQSPIITPVIRIVRNSGKFSQFVSSFHLIFCTFSEPRFAFSSVLYCPVWTHDIQYFYYLGFKKIICKIYIMYIIDLGPVLSFQPLSV